MSVGLQLDGRAWRHLLLPGPGEAAAVPEEREADTARDVSWRCRIVFGTGGPPSLVVAGREHSIEAGGDARRSRAAPGRSPFGSRRSAGCAAVTPRGRGPDGRPPRRGGTRSRRSTAERRSRGMRRRAPRWSAPRGNAPSRSGSDRGPRGESSRGRARRVTSVTKAPAVEHEVRVQRLKASVGVDAHAQRRERGVALGGDLDVELAIELEHDRPAGASGQQGHVGGDDGRVVLLAAEGSARGPLLDEHLPRARHRAPEPPRAGCSTGTASTR